MNGSNIRPLQVVIRFLVHRPHAILKKLKFGHYHSICIAHAPSVVGWELWFVPCGLLCTIVNMHNGIITKPARPQAILEEALTRNRIATWSGLKGESRSRNPCPLSTPLVPLSLLDYMY